MIIIVALLLGLALLYFWLRGHWFARVLAFLAIGAAASLVIVANVNTIDRSGGLSVVAALCAMPICWGLASIPVYCRQHRERSANAYRIIPNDTGQALTR